MLEKLRLNASGGEWGSAAIGGGKDAIVMNVKPVGVHGDDRAVVDEFDTPCHGVILPVEPTR